MTDRAIKAATPLVALVAGLAAFPAQASWDWRNYPLPPKALTHTAPVYPPAAEAAGVIGRVDGEMDIADDGTVERIDVHNEFPIRLGFAQAAQDAVKTWTYPPHHAGTYLLRVKFRLAEDDAPIPTSFSAWSLLAGHPTIRLPEKPYYRPPYPQMADTYKIEGEAKLVLSIDAQGNASRIHIAGETPANVGFAESAHNWALALKFSGQVPGRYTLIVKFKSR